MKCRNCDSDQSLGFRRLCVVHSHEAGQAMLEALHDARVNLLDTHPATVDLRVEALRKVLAAIALAEGAL